MEAQFIGAWEQARQQAQALGIRMRPVEPGQALTAARRILDGRRLSDGFSALAEQGRLELSLEALAVDRRFTPLFTDDQANEALTRLLEAGYRFR